MFLNVVYPFVKFSSIQTLINLCCGKEEDWFFCSRVCHFKGELICCDGELFFRLLIWGFEEVCNLTYQKSYLEKQKYICNWSLPPYTYNEMQTKSINHKEIDQSFKEFVSSIKNLVWELLNHTQREINTQFATTWR